MFQGYVGKFLEPPKNGWLELDPFLLGQKGLFFKGENVSFREATNWDDPPSRNFFGLSPRNAVAQTIDSPHPQVRRFVVGSQ